MHRFRFVYPARFTPDAGGGYVVTFRDVPEAITQGDDEEEATSEAADALEEAIAGRMRLGEEISGPSKAEAGEYPIALPIDTAAKAALYIAIHQSGLSKVELAAQLGCDEKEVRRLLDPYHPSKLPRVQQALEALGKRLIISMEDAAARAGGSLG